MTAGPSFDTGQVFFSGGRLAELIFVGSQHAIDGNDMLSIAQVAAARIDAAGLGS
jgi:hypothetical protein